MVYANMFEIKGAEFAWLVSRMIELSREPGNAQKPTRSRAIKGYEWACWDC
jgi:hypothetical protein